MSTPTPVLASKTPAMSSQTPRPYLNGASTTSTPRSNTSPGVSRTAPQPHTAAKTPGSTSMHAPTPARAPGSAQMAPSLSQMSGASVTSSGQAAATATSGLGLTAGSGTLGVSPSPAHGLNFASPAFGLDIGTPSLLESGSLGGMNGVNGLGGIDGMGGIGGSAMNMTLSDMGLGRSGRGTDEERRHKLSTVLGKLLDRNAGRSGASGMGRISDEGIRRVGAWAGFDVEVEAKYNKPQLEGSRPIVIAGRNAILIDISLKDHIAQKVQVSFSSEQNAVTAHEKDAADVLLQDLTPATALVSSKLDRFAANLETLARLDKLSSEQFNAIEAITGVYTSLNKLYEHEMKAAQVLYGSDKDKSGRHVMCQNSGRPNMHSSRRVGLTLDYFVDKSAVEPWHTGLARSKTSQEGAMKVDTPDSGTEHKTFALELTLEPPSGQIYTPARNTPDWLSITSPDSEMPDSTVADPADHQDPATSQAETPNRLKTYTWFDPPLPIPSSNEIGPETDPMSAATNLDMTSKLPSAFFIAKLRPHITLPSAVASEILQAVRSQQPMTILPTSWLGACLTSSSSKELQVGIDVRADLVGRGMRTVYTPHGDKRHAYPLYDLHPQTAVSLSSLPIEHPRQMVAVLPSLRQWGFVQRLVEGVSGDSSSMTGSKAGTMATVGQMNEQKAAQAVSSKAQTMIDRLKPEVGLDELLNKSTSTARALQIDISVSAQPVPTFALEFPTTIAIARVAFRVLPNAKVSILEQTLVAESGNEKPDAIMGDEGPDSTSDPKPTVSESESQVERMARALEICGNLGTWIEWLRQRYCRPEAVS